ncbi:MAG: arylsulfatase [Verrucomicrobia bacterium]|nr:arylsulfatase [Verrucomicrobiota bacterium]
MRIFLPGSLAILISLASAWAEIKPNIVLIYADDLGYGDVSCYGATKIKTPHVDRLAREGIRFTSGYAPAATCTPSRYSMMTGEYAFRKRGTGILRSDAAMIIEPGSTTFQSILQKGGYHTGIVGKWHLGLGDGTVDWNGDIKPGPLETGFNYAFLIPATGDRVPAVFIENHRVIGLDPKDPLQVSFGQKVGNEPTGKENPDKLKMHPSHGHDQTIVNGISRIGYMSGAQSARWVDEDIADIITRKAIDFIDGNKKKPFFLFFSLHDIHVPRTPHSRFAGKSGMGPRGDVILQMDWCVGEILKTLDRKKLAKNTIVIFTSDNGPVLDDGYRDDAVEKIETHKPAGPFRGGKYSAFEGGTRVPFILRWPGKVKPGVSDALLSQIDFPASFAAFTRQKLSEKDAPDSVNVLPALLGESEIGRDQLVEQAGALALRQGSWKYIEPREGPRVNKNTNIELGNDSAPQLYNLTEDPGETRNLAARHPAKTQELQDQLRKIRERSN